MIRALSCGIILLILAGCAGPEEELMAEPAPADTMGGAVLEAPVAAAPLPSEVACDDPGDGIGGTGCPVE